MRGRKDIESLNIPFMGEIPNDKPAKGSKSNSRIVVKPGKRNVINEAFRVLRTNLGFLSQKDKGNVLMVTSFNPGSGKTFISMNMAVSLSLIHISPEHRCRPRSVSGPCENQQSLC